MRTSSSQPGTTTSSGSRRRDIAPDLEGFRTKRPPLPPTNDQPPRHRQGQKFLQGPIPLAWLTTAGRLPGQALHVGIGLWFRAGLRKSATVALSQATLREFGVTRWSAYRGLRELERAGLVNVRRSRGRLARVTLLEPPTLLEEAQPPGAETSE